MYLEKFTMYVHVRMLLNSFFTLSCRPQLSSAGGSRLLQRAIRGLGGRGQLPRGGARQQEGAARQPGSSSKSAGPRARKQPKLTSTTSATEEGTCTSYMYMYMYMLVDILVHVGYTGYCYLQCW